MTTEPTNLSHVEAMAWKEQRGLDGKSYRFKDLSGQHIGVFIEELPPGSPSSMHHFHTLEEEHVMILEGEATLILGDEESVVTAGDHIWFGANVEVAHHFENRGNRVCRYLVFGERTADDVVIYPQHQVMLVKKLGRRAFTTRPFRPPGDGNG